MCTRRDGHKVSVGRKGPEVTATHRSQKPPMCIPVILCARSMGQQAQKGSREAERQWALSSPLLPAVLTPITPLESTMLDSWQRKTLIGTPVFWSRERPLVLRAVARSIGLNNAYSILQELLEMWCGGGRVTRSDALTRRGQGSSGGIAALEQGQVSRLHWQEVPLRNLLRYLRPFSTTANSCHAPVWFRVALCARPH